MPTVLLPIHLSVWYAAFLWGKELKSGHVERWNSHTFDSHVLMAYHGWGVTYPLLPQALQDHTLLIRSPDIFHENNVLRVTVDTPITHGAVLNDGVRHPQWSGDPDIVVPHRQSCDDRGVVISIDFLVQVITWSVRVKGKLEADVGFYRI